MMRMGDGHSNGTTVVVFAGRIASSLPTTELTRREEDSQGKHVTQQT